MGREFGDHFISKGSSGGRDVPLDAEPCDGAKPGGGET